MLDHCCFWNGAENPNAHGFFERIFPHLPDFQANQAVVKSIQCKNSQSPSIGYDFHQKAFFMRILTKAAWVERMDVDSNSLRWQLSIVTKTGHWIHFILKNM